MEIWLRGVRVATLQISKCTKSDGTEQYMLSELSRFFSLIVLDICLSLTTAQVKKT